MKFSTSIQKLSSEIFKLLTYYRCCTYVIMLSIRMMQKHDCNIFNNMQKTDFSEFRNLIIEMVLHTDMSQHFTQLKAMKTLLQQHNGELRFVNLAS